MVNHTAFFRNYCSVVKCMHGKLFVCLFCQCTCVKTTNKFMSQLIPMWYLAHVKNKPVKRPRSSQAAAKEVRRQDQKPLYPWWIVNSSQMVSNEVLCFRCHEGTIKVLCIEWKNLKFGSLKHDWWLCWQIVHPAASQTFGWSPGIVSVYRAENSFIVRSACFHRAFIELSSCFHRAFIALSSSFHRAFIVLRWCRKKITM